MEKHRRAARIKANDGDGHKLSISVEFVSINGLVLSEVRQVRTRLARLIAAHLPDLPFTDYGPENVKVNLLRRL